MPREVIHGTPRGPCLADMFFSEMRNDVEIIHG